jgi:hypothetical protein
LRAITGASPHPPRDTVSPPMSAEHEVTVRVVSPEEADDGVAEFWIGGELFGLTRLQDGELVLRIEPRIDGSAVVVNAHSLAGALAQAKVLLSSY